MKILLTKVPRAKQVVSLGNPAADFCGSRATCHSKHPPNNHFESRRTLSARHKLADWQLNSAGGWVGGVGRGVRAHSDKGAFIRKKEKVKSAIVHFLHINRLVSDTREYIFFAFDSAGWQRPTWVQDDTEDVQCDVCLLCRETIAAGARGASLCCGSPPDTDRKGRLYTMFSFFLRPIPFRTDRISHSEGPPLRGPRGGQGPRQSRQDTTEAPVSKCKADCVRNARRRTVKKKTCDKASALSGNRTQWQGWGGGGGKFGKKFYRVFF